MMSRAASRTLLPLLSVNFIGTLGYSIVLPFLVFLVTQMGGNSFVYALIGATYSFFQLIGAPVLGTMSDRFGRKKILLVSQAGTFLSWGIFLGALFLPQTEILRVEHNLTGSFVISLPLAVLFLGRALDGLTGGNISVANAYLADISNDRTRKANFGKMAASSNLGFIFGPLLAGALGATVFGIKLPVIAALVISFLAIFLISGFLPESKTKIIDKKLVVGQATLCLHLENKPGYKIHCRKSGLAHVFGIKGLPQMLALYFLIFLGFNIFYTAFPVHAATGLKWGTGELGIFFAVLSGAMVVVQGPVLSWLSSRFSDGLLYLVGAIVLSGAFLLMMSQGIVMLFLSALCFAVGNGLMWPSYMSILSRTGPASDQGFVQGIATSAGSLASILGLIMGGVLYERFGATTFLATAIVIGVVILSSLNFCFKGPERVR